MTEDNLLNIRRQTPLDEVSDDDIEAAMPPKPLASLFDISYVYAKLDALASAASIESIDSEYVSFLTPSKRQAVFTQSQADGDHAGNPNGVVIRFEVDDAGDVSLADPAVETERFTQEDVYRLGYSTVGNKTVHKTVYSVTFHKSGDPEDIKDVLENQLTKWFETDGAQSVREERTEGGSSSLLDSIAQLGKNDDVLEEVKTATDEVLATDEDDASVIGEAGMMVTVSVKRPSDSEWKYPGELREFNEAMKRNRTENLKEGKSATKEQGAYGEGRGLVSDEEGFVLGGTATPMATSAGKQYGLYDNLNPGTAHQTRPLSEDVANVLSSAEDIIKAFRADLGFQQRLYLIPYYDAIVDADKARDMYAVLETVRDDDEVTPDLTYISALEDYDGLRLYAMLTTFEQSAIRNVQLEEPSLDASMARRIADAHLDITNSWLFNSEASPFVSRRENVQSNDTNGWFYADTQKPLLTQLVRLGYFNSTIVHPTYGDVDDPETLSVFPHYRRSLAAVRGDTQSTTALIDAYVERIVEFQQNSLANDGEGVPAVVIEQFVQLIALGRAGGLDDDHPYSTEETPTSEGMTDTVDLFDPDATDSREDRLAKFIADRNALAEDHERRAAFVFGALVGRLSAFQRRVGVSSTLIQRYPVDSVTKASLPDAVGDVMGLNNTYSETESDGNGLMNRRYTKRLMRDVHDETRNWDISESDIRFHYALGIAYGTEDQSPNTDDEESDEDAAVEADD